MIRCQWARLNHLGTSGKLVSINAFSFAQPQFINSKQNDILKTFEALCVQANFEIITVTLLILLT